MKGLAMKIGQITSYMGVPLPEEVERSLARLQTGVVGMDPEAVEAALVAAFGEGSATLFERFDITPIAAASIGQVHRARFEGREVAVKIRYPDVAAGFEADIGMLNRIAGMASLASAVDGRAVVKELAARLQEECDYLREAERQAQFARAFADDPEVEVPEVVSARSSDAVLTTGWAGDTRSFAALCADAGAEDRRRVALTMTRFAYRSLLTIGTIQADPHPGNFLFKDGVVVFLDFGCVRVLGPDLSAAVRAQIEAVRDDDRPAFRRSCEDLEIVGDPRRFDYDHHFLVMEHLYRPFTRPTFRIDAAYVQEGMAFNGPSNPNARTMTIPSAYVWVMRLQWGLSSVLAKLDVEVDYGSTLAKILAMERAPLAPLSGAETT